MRRLFGTDGVRGAAGSELTAGLATSLSVAAVRVFAARGAFALAATARRRPAAVVGRDPRASGEFLEAAVVAGLASRGVDVLRLGVVPTPAVAFLTGDLDADFGVMLSASHNPAADNGIKFFARGGLKLPDEVESDIEAALASPAPDTVPPGGFGRVREAPQAADRYLHHLLATVGVLTPVSGAEPAAASSAGQAPGSSRPLSGLSVVVDCANGAACRLAPLLLRQAGAEVVVIGAEPDGDNINAGCGSTSLGALTRAVLAHGADAGIAHDGDADRCLAVDAAGQVVDGDQILAVLALDRHLRGQLAKDTVVTTVMSNLGFRRAMQSAGISVQQTQVGDRYLVAAMQAGGFELGGEQSGHIILLDHATTGDGLLTALHLLTAVAQAGRPLAELAAVMTRYPQVLINIADVDKASVAASGLVSDAVMAAEHELGESGRVLIRPSGTEPAVRVMVEAMSREQAERLAGRLADTVRSLA